MKALLIALAIILGVAEHAEAADTRITTDDLDALLADADGSIAKYQRDNAPRLLEEAMQRESVINGQLLDTYNELEESKATNKQLRSQLAAVRAELRLARTKTHHQDNWQQDYDEYEHKRELKRLKNRLINAQVMNQQLQNRHRFRD